MNTHMPPSVNFHLLHACNMKCKFCFATFLDTEVERQNQDRALRIIRQLAEFGFQKITFAGGEPTLWRGLPQLLAEARQLGMTTMLVTNGSRLHNEEYYQQVRPHLDWLILSIDSVDPEVNRLSGRTEKGSDPISAQEYLALCMKAKADGLRLKINTVVSRYNVNDDLTGFMLRAQPERWKIFQALPVAGQNDANWGQFEINPEEYQAYLSRHSSLSGQITIVPEDNDAMTGSYVMVGPNGCFFDNTSGRHTYSQPILKVGVKTALSQVSVDAEKFFSRGGQYEW